MFVVITAVFSGNGFQAGAYTVLLADLVGVLDLTRSAVGLALAGLSAAAMAGSLVGGWLADRVATRATFWIGHADAMPFSPRSPRRGSYSQLLAAMIGGGVLVGMFDLIPETLAGDHEREHAKRRRCSRASDPRLARCRPHRAARLTSAEAGCEK